MKSSIQKQLFFIITGLLSGTILVFLFINNLFLEKYYFLDTERKVHKMYEIINLAGREERLGEESTIEEIRNFSVRNNISTLVINENSEAVMFSAFNNGEELYRRLVGYVLGIHSQVTGENQFPETGQVFIYKDNYKNNDYMEMFGQLDNGCWYIISITLESIHTSVRVANRFLAYVGIFAILVGSIVSLLFSRRFTRPILEIARLSEKIRNLDFEARYQGNNNNEIGLLGNNMNRLSESLEQTISELKTANNELKQDLQKKEQMEQMRSEFLSNVSHELKTPIALISGYAEGLEEGIIEDKESRDFYLQVIKEEASKMNTMVQKLLTLNQLEFGDEIMTIERFDIVPMIKDYVQASEVLYKPKEISVTLPGESKCFVWGDQYKVEEVLMNYFTNAVHYCKGERKIHISLKRIDNKVKIGVFNSGDPIEEDSIPYLWDKFYKVDKARTREYGGSGIGLSIVKAIVSGMNQEYGVENYENGVCFWFTLDYAGAEEK